MKRGPRRWWHVNDWLTAEREILWSPPAELTETDHEFHARLAIPGFDAKDIQVTVMPTCIMAKADASHTSEKHEPGLLFSEIAERTVFRRIDLPVPIEVDKVKAFLDKGVLQLTAEKLAAPDDAGKEKNVAVAA